MKPGAASGIGLGPPSGPVNNTYNADVTAVAPNPNTAASVLTDRLVAMHAPPGR